MFITKKYYDHQIRKLKDEIESLKFQNENILVEKTLALSDLDFANSVIDSLLATIAQLDEAIYVEDHLGTTPYPQNYTQCRSEAIKRHVKRLSN